MRRRHVLKASVLAFGAVAAALAMATMPTPASAQEIVARLSFHWGPKHSAAIMSDKFAAEVNERAKGRLKIEVYKSGQLFGIRETMAAVTSGAVHMGGLVGVVAMPPIDRNYNVTSFPGYFNSFEQMRGFFKDTPEGKRVWDNILKKTNSVLIFNNALGPYTSFSVKSDMSSVEKFKGLKARALSEVERPRWQALGADVLSLPTSEVYTALQSGMIDTLNTVPDAIEAYDWWKFLKYGQLPFSFYADAYMLANATWFNSLPKDLQALMLEVGAKVEKEATEKIMAQSLDVLKRFQERGGKVFEAKGQILAQFDKLDAERVIPVLAKTVDSDVLAAARKYVGKK
jgi:TRAP-type C4-dicarboxylate transport system substrate-binding protein